MSKTGEKPGQGTYYCKECGKEVYLKNSTDHLPPCPQCKKEVEYITI